jgi:hypothetical protein
MAGEGMDTYLICPTCHAKGLQVLSPSATHQKFGHPNRAIWFSCVHCQSICDEPAVTPMPQCLISQQVMDVMRRIPAGSIPLINWLIDFETLEQCAWLQPNDRSPGEDSQPQEFCKHGPTELLELYWKAFNAYLRGDPPSIGEHEWAGAVTGYIPKIFSRWLASVRSFPSSSPLWISDLIMPQRTMGVLMTHKKDSACLGGHNAN